MKLKDLAEAADQSGPDINEVVSDLKQLLQQQKAQLESSQTEDTTHSIGGNFSAHRSGKVEIRAPYDKPGAYNSSVRYNMALLIGSGIPEALGQAKDCYEQAYTLLEDKFDATMTDDRDGTRHYKVGGAQITLSYDYGRNFCVVGFRVSLPTN